MPNRLLVDGSSIVAHITTSLNWYSVSCHYFCFSVSNLSHSASSKVHNMHSRRTKTESDTKIQKLACPKCFSLSQPNEIPPWRSTMIRHRPLSKKVRQPRRKRRRPKEPQYEWAAAAVAAMVNRPNLWNPSLPIKSWHFWSTARRSIEHTLLIPSKISATLKLYHHMMMMMMVPVCKMLRGMQVLHS